MMNFYKNTFKIKIKFTKGTKEIKKLKILKIKS